MSERNLSGHWLSRYSYQSGDSGELNSSEHTVIFEEGEDIVGRSLPQEDGSELKLYLKHDPENRVLTGVWKEKTSPTGRYKGALFHGALQLILSKEDTEARGKWIGFDRARTTVNAGEWELIKR